MFTQSLFFGLLEQFVNFHRFGGAVGDIAFATFARGGE